MKRITCVKPTPFEVLMHQATHNIYSGIMPEPIPVYERFMQITIPADEQIADYVLFMKFYDEYETIHPPKHNMTGDEEIDYDSRCRDYATKQFIKAKKLTQPKKNQTEYGKEAERLIQLHVDAGLTEEQAWKATIITLEYYGCSKQGNSHIDTLKQKAYNYLTGVGKVTKTK